MSFKGLFLTSSGSVLLMIVVFIGISLKRAAVEADASTRVVRAESRCASQVESAIDLIKTTGGEKGFEIRVTETSNHYNHQLNKCLVAVTTYENRDTNVLVKSLVSPSDKALLLWSLGGTLPSSDRSCYAENAAPLDCTDADRRWKAFMTE